MHEMSIATAVLEAVQAEAERHGGARVVKVGMRVGEWSGVDPDSLQFCFEALVAGTDTPAPALEIELRHRENRCGNCGTVFAIKDFEIQCPNCGEPVTEPVSGNELEVAFIELEEP
jgi:hydrogenase nickel incorporation protein HypA/HybF